MSERIPVLLLKDIQNSIKKISAFTRGMSFEEFESNFLVQDAVRANFSDIGEAISRLPQTFKTAHPNVNWRLIKDFRNKIVHEYFGIDLTLIWDVIVNKLPAFNEELSSIAKSITDL